MHRDKQEGERIVNGACSNDRPGERADVAIVGAGVVGMAVACTLQEEGLSVVVVDRGAVGRGASYGNAGAFGFSDIMPLASPGVMRKVPGWLMDPLGPLTIRPAYLLQIAPWLYRFWRASSAAAAHHSMRAQAELMRLSRSENTRLIEQAGLSRMLASAGSLELYESRSEFERSLPGWKLREREGIEFHHLTGSEISAVQPGLSPRFTHATFVPGSQSISDPYDYVCNLAKLFEQRGGRIRRSEVLAVEPEGDGAILRLATGEDVTAGHAVIAGGAWSKPLAAALGDQVPLETERGYNTTLPAGAFDVKCQLVFGGHGFVVSRLSSGVRIGGAVELGGLKLAPNYKRSANMLMKAKRFLPDLKTNGGREWMGYRPSMPDSLPVIGHSAKSRRVIHAFGHGHLGLTQSAATARIVCDLICDRNPPIDMSPFRPDRFS